MKTLIFLLLPLSALCQRIEFLEGAGVNPRHIESIGPDGGWVEVWPGPMASTSGQVLNICIPEWENVDTVFIKLNSQKYTINAHLDANPKVKGFGFFGFERSKGWFYLTYTVKRRNKKA